MSKAILIENNNVHVRPKDEEVRSIFESYLTSSPYDSTRLEDLHCSIVYADRSLANVPLIYDNVYHAFIEGAQIWLDPYLQTRNLVVLLKSPELVNRHNEILTLSGAEPAHSKYVPHLTLAFDIPDSTRRNRWWLNQVINDFNTKYRGTLIGLYHETMTSSSGFIPHRSNTMQKDDEIIYTKHLDHKDY